MVLTAAAARLSATVTSSTIASMAEGAVGTFTFEAPASAALAAMDATDGSDEGNIDSVSNGPTPQTITFSSHVYAIQVGDDSTATAGLRQLAANTGGQYLTGDATNLADLIIGVLNQPS